ncbi:MAG TPA: hypothetical protein VFC19_37775 [Candidatus Limnocylindrales bacterium]|nr:hypothetical protein [Candidatus Limnocylindrales bacterium]
MKRLILLLIVLATAAACSPSKSGSLGAGPTGIPGTPPSASPYPTPFETPSETPSGASNSRSLTIQVWFVREGRLFATTRTRPVTQNTSQLALTELATGPSTVETAGGVGSAVMTGTRFDIKGISADGTETVSFPP